MSPAVRVDDLAEPPSGSGEKRLLLVTHFPVHGVGGPSARWRSFAAHLPGAGWWVDAVSPPPAATWRGFSALEEDRRRAARRARVTGALRRLGSPAFAVLGVRPAAFPPATAWLPAAARETDHRLSSGRYDAVLATGPPAVALLAARLAARRRSVPLVLELRDLWAANPAYDRRGGLLGAIEARLFRAAGAIVVTTPEAAADVRRRHPRVAERVACIPNGFEPELLHRAPAEADGGPPASARRLTLLHSGTLTPERPLEPLLRVLRREPHRSRVRLVLHGPITPPIARQVAGAQRHVEVEVIPPSSWEDAVRRIAEADVAVVAQAREAGDATAVAAKVYEYLALGKPVLCLTHGGATEALLRRLGADELCARLDDEASIVRAVQRLHEGPLPEPVPRELLAPYSRRALAADMGRLLDSLAGADSRPLTVAAAQ